MIVEGLGGDPMDGAIGLGASCSPTPVTPTSASMMALFNLCGLASSTVLKMFVMPGLYTRSHREPAP